MANLSFSFAATRASTCCLLIALLLALSASTEAVLQTSALNVRIVERNSEYQVDSYNDFVSQAWFGRQPSMNAAEEQELRLVSRAHSKNNEDIWLCENATEDSDRYSSSEIILVPRGKCTFERKAWHAQQRGAGGIFIYGNLASKYSLNTTLNTTHFTTMDIIFPRNLHDYDCSMGEATIPADQISLDPLPYNSDQNDILLSGDSSTNICRDFDKDQLSGCPSNACLLTGPRNDTTDSYHACCAWDLAIWMPPDTTLERNVVTIPAAYLTMTQANALMSQMKTNTVYVTLYARWEPQYNISSGAIWMMGVFVAALAAYLSASDYHQRIKRTLKRLQRGSQDSRQERPSQRDAVHRPQHPVDESLELTAEHAIGFILVASTSLLVLFYFKPYAIVKFMYGMGCSKAASTVLFWPLARMVMKLFGMRNIVVWNIEWEEIGEITIRDIVSHVLGYALGLSWLFVAFTVHHPDRLTFFWVTQDILGACMCVMFLQVIKLNSLRVASILLMVAFFYDIFFVFVSPIFFGKSVMITVATSGGPPEADPEWCEKYPYGKECQGGDPLPMLLTFPRIMDYQGGSSMLGLGDIVLPGLLLGFAARYDAAKRLVGISAGGNGNTSNSYSCPERKYCGGCGLCSGGYFPPMVVAYAVGLLMANVAIYVMRMGQPALLYLVPACLGTLCFMGWRRGELKDMWEDPKIIRTADSLIYGHSSHAALALHTPLPQEDDDDDPQINESQLQDDTRTEEFTDNP